MEVHKDMRNCRFLDGECVYLSHTNCDQGFNLMEYHWLVSKLDKRFWPAERERSQTGAVTTDQYQSFGLGHFGVDAAHVSWMTDFTCPASSRRWSLDVGPGFTYPRRGSPARGDVLISGDEHGNLLNVVGVRIVGDRGGGSGRCRVSSSETWTVHSADRDRDQRGA